MTTEPAQAHSGTLVDRVVNWLLDVDGDIYGDERERLRWYEAISLTASFQWVIVPWAMAILVWFADRETVPFLIAMLVLFWLPLPLAQWYIKRKRVRTVPDRRTAKYWIIVVVAGLPYLVFALGAFTVFGEFTDDSSWWAAAIGGVVGGGLAMLALVMGKRRERRREAARADLD